MSFAQHTHTHTQAYEAKSIDDGVVMLKRKKFQISNLILASDGEHWWSKQMMTGVV